MFIPFIHLKSCGSTQDRLVEYPGEGPFLLWSDRQTAGRGRRDRHWQSPSGGLYFSLRQPLEQLLVAPALHLMGAAYLWGELLESLPGVSSFFSLKWPNDLLFQNRKIGGFLGETRRSHLYLGIGINVNNPVQEDSSFRRPAISLGELSGRVHSRRTLLMDWMDRYRGTLDSDRSEVHRPKVLEDRLQTLGKTVRVEGREGRAVGLDSDGGLILRSTRGETVVHVGEAVEINERGDPTGSGRGQYEHGSRPGPGPYHP